MTCYECAVSRGLLVVQAYMQHIQDAAAVKMRLALPARTKW